MTPSRALTWLLLALCMIVTSFALVASEPATTYHIETRLHPEDQLLTGTLFADVANATDAPMEQAFFTLTANWGASPNPHVAPSLVDARYPTGFDPSWTRILAVRYADDRPASHHLEPGPGAMQTYSLDDVLLVVELDAPVAVGETVSLVIEFETRYAHARTGDNAVYQDTLAWRFGWHPFVVPEDEVRNGALLLPPAFHSAEITVPAGFDVYGGADESEVIASTDEETTYRLDSIHPVRSIPLVVGPELVAYSTQAGDVELVVVGLPGIDATLRLIASLATDILAHYADRYGPIAYRRIVIAEDPAPGFFGMASDGLILLGSSILRLKDMPVLGMYDRLLEYLLAHELAHLWWGIGVGTDLNAENWISEGFAEYLSISYFEATYGGFEPNLFAHLESGIIEELIDAQFGYINLRSHLSEGAYLSLLKNDFDEPIVQPIADSHALNGLTIRTYNKGYLVLRALEGLLGRDALTDLVRSLHQSHDRGRLTVEAFETAVAEVSDTDLGWFFDAWLHDAKETDIAVEGFTTTSTDDSAWHTSVFLALDGTPYPVVVRATLADETTVDTVWDGAGRDRITLETASEVVSIHVDPDELSIDANRFNNHWPRRILIAGPYIEEDHSEPIGRPLDAYVISIDGTSISGSFRNDHMWSFSMMPHLATDEDGATDWDESFRTVDATSFFTVIADRSNRYTGSLALIDWDPGTFAGSLDGRIDWTHTVYSAKESGLPGVVWQPTATLRTSIGATGSLPEIDPFAAISVSLSGLPKRAWAVSVELCTSLPGIGLHEFARADAAATTRIRFAPHWYLDLNARVGGRLTGTLPESRAFDLGELYTLDAELAKDARGLFRVDLRLPPNDEMAGYRLFNLSRVESVSAGVFLQAAAGWNTGEMPDLEDLRIEAGATATFSISGILGIPVHVTLGAAVPVKGADLDPEGRLIFGLSMPIPTQ